VNILSPVTLRHEFYWTVACLMTFSVDQTTCGMVGWLINNEFGGI
jgi:hypothetical protein